MFKIFEKIFGWVTSETKMQWGKFFALIFGGFFLLTGYIIYDQRNIITAEIYTTVAKAEYSIDRARTPAILRELMRDTGALAVTAWEFDWATNQRRLVIAMNRDGTEIMSGLDILSIIRPNSTNNPLVVNALFASQHACVNIDDDSSADVKLVKSTIQEVTVYCISGLRTAYGEVRGAITVYLPKQPSDQVVVGAKLRSAAEKLIHSR